MGHTAEIKLERCANGAYIWICVNWNLGLRWNKADCSTAATLLSRQRAPKPCRKKRIVRVGPYRRHGDILKRTDSPELLFKDPQIAFVFRTAFSTLLNMSMILRMYGTAADSTRMAFDWNLEATTHQIERMIVAKISTFEGSKGTVGRFLIRW